MENIPHNLTHSTPATERSLKDVLTSMRKLDSTPRELRRQLDAGYEDAMSARYALLQKGNTATEEDVLRAEGCSLIAVYQGEDNEGVLVNTDKGEELISVEEYKKRQILSTIAHAREKKDEALEMAAYAHARTFEIEIIEAQSLFNQAGAKINEVVQAAKNNPRARQLTATAVFLMGSTVASSLNAGSAAAAETKIDVNPIGPGDAKEVRPGQTVTIVKKKQTPTNVLPATPVTIPQMQTPETPPSERKVGTVKKTKSVPQTVTEVVRDVKPVENGVVKVPAIKVERKGLVNTPSEGPTIHKADNKGEKKGTIIRTLPNPVTPTPGPEVAPAAPAPEAPAPLQLPEVIIDPSLHTETMWSQEHLTFIRDNLDMYLAIEKESGVEWEIVVATHYRENSLRMVNPDNWQGAFQLFSKGREFTPGPITKEEFIRQGIMAAEFLKEKSKIGVVNGQLSLSDPDEVKDTLFSYNGRAQSYAEQAAELGFSLPAEGSPYVMNLADDKRNSLKNPRWGQYLFDNATQKGPANQSPGAWVLIEGLIKINQIAHDQAIAKHAADQKAAADAVAAEAQRAAAAKVAEEAAPKIETISQPKNELAPVTALHFPVPEGSPVSPQYPGHKGIDFAVKAGTPFYAAMGGTVEVRKFDVTDKQFCKDAFANLGRSVNEIKPEDRVQLEVRITRIIDGKKYVTVYAHMDRIDVEDGQIVEAGHQIGLTGNTGCSTGDHAHFEMQVDNIGSIAPHLLFDGEKWKAAGAIVPWSIDINPQSVDSDGVRTNEDGPHDTFCGCGNHSSLSSVDESTSIDQKAQLPPVDTESPQAKLEAMKRVIAMREQIAARNESQSSRPVEDEGYLSIQR